MFSSKVEYSYIQYHWFPITFTQIEGLCVSSRAKANVNDGIDMKSKIIQGISVHMNSNVEK